jgi:hypothetical protein
MGTQRYMIDYSGSYDYSPSSTARLGGLPPDAEPPLTDRPSHLPAALLCRDYSWQLRSSAQSGWAPRLGSGERTTTSRVGSGCAVASSPPVAVAASPTATSICSGAPSAASCTSGVNLSMGTAAGILLPSASAPVNKKTRASASSDGYDYSLGGTTTSAEYSPSTTRASVNVASVAGALGSA